MRLLLFLCVLLCACPSAYALSKGTPDTSCSHSIARAAEMFAAEHEGRSPTSWADIQPYINQPWDEAFPNVLPTKRYAILSAPLRLPGHYGQAELLALTRRPFRDISYGAIWFGKRSTGLGAPGRYIIYRDVGGAHFYWSSVTEEYVQEAFRGHEELMPTPDHEGGRPHEIWARWKTGLGWSVVVAIAFVLLRRFIRRKSSSNADLPSTRKV